MINKPCIWCGQPHITIEHAHFGTPRSDSKPYYAICGSCFATTPAHATVEELVDNVCNNPPTSIPEDVDECVWCNKTGVRAHGQQNRHYLILMHQGVIKEMPMPKFDDLHFKICKNCQSCAPMKQKPWEAEDVANSGPSGLI